MGFRWGRGLAVGASLAVMVASMQGVAQAGTQARAAAAVPQQGTTLGTSGMGSVAGDAASVAPGFTVKLRDPKGGRLDRVSLKGNGGRDHKIVIGKKMLVTGKVPRGLAQRVAGDSVALQNRFPVAGESWQTVARVRIAKDGTFAEKIRPTRKKFLHKREYRVAVTVPQARKTVGAGSVSAAATTTATSATTTATGVVEFYLNLTNNTGDNLTVFVPTAQTSTTTDGNPVYQYAQFDVDNNRTSNWTYTNPPAGTAVSWYVNKQNCVGQCTNYTPNWSANWSRNATTCQDDPPQFTNGSTTNVTLSGQFGAGYNGETSGPAGSCEFELGSGFQNFFQGHIWIAIAMAVVITALLVTLVVTDGTAAPEEELLADETLSIISDSSSEGDSDYTDYCGQNCTAFTLVPATDS